MVGAQNHVEHDLHSFEHSSTLGVHCLSLARDEIQVEGVAGSQLSEAIFNPRVVNKDMKGWRAKLRDAFKIDSIPSVSETGQQLYGYVSLMKEKAPIPSRYPSKVL